MHHDSAVRPLPRQIVGGTICRDAEPLPVSTETLSTLTEHRGDARPDRSAPLQVHVLCSLEVGFNIKRSGACQHSHQPVRRMYYNARKECLPAAAAPSPH